MTGFDGLDLLLILCAAGMFTAAVFIDRADKLEADDVERLARDTGVLRGEEWVRS